MLSSRVSQLNILLQVSIVFLISSLLVKVIEGQDDWPVVLDPFPDEIPPEPPATPPPTVDCTAACQDKVDEAMSYIKMLEDRLSNANYTLFSRILDLEGNYYSTLSQRVTNLENYLPGNVTDLNFKINQDVDGARKQLSDDVAELRRDLEYKINNIPTSGGGGDNTKAMEVFVNLTQRINGLENGKIQHLITDNNLWRQNFRVVNATFSKLRKSNGGNNVILTG